MVNCWYDQYRAEIESLIEYSRLSYDRGLTSAMGGNVSIRCRDGIIISASNVCLRSVSPDTLILTDVDGNQLVNPYNLKPSKEMFMHLGVYKVRPDANSVLHLHPPYAIALTSALDSFPLVTESANRKLISVPKISDCVPGSKDLAQHVSDAVIRSGEDVHCLALENHGIISFGSSAEDAFYTADLLEDTAKIAYLKMTLESKFAE